MEFEGKIHKRTSVSSTKLRFKKMRMEVDALDYATERILSMKCKDGRWKPIVKIVDNGLDFYFSLFILFYCVLFFFYFSIFRTTRS